jgi:hypothetical protein
MLLREDDNIRKNMVQLSFTELKNASNNPYSMYKDLRIPKKINLLNTGNLEELNGHRR